jgi:hypothetical protein
MRASDPHAEAFSSGHWTHQLYRFENPGVEEIRGTIGGMDFPLIHDWTYGGTKLAEGRKPFSPIQRATLYEHHGTSTQGEVSTTIRKAVDPNGSPPHRTGRRM